MHKLASIFKQTLHQITEQKWLLLPGVLMAAASGGLDRGIVRITASLQRIREILVQAGIIPRGEGAVRGGSGGTENGGPAPGGNGRFPDISPAVGGADLVSLLVVGSTALVALLCIGTMLLLGAMLATRLTGGLLVAVVGLDVSFQEALRYSWRRIWPMVIIISIPPIPVTVGAILSISIIGLYLGNHGLVGNPTGMLALLRESRELWWWLAALNVPFALASLGLAVLQPVADRTCILENNNAVDSFRDAWRIARSRLPLVLAITLLQFATGVGAAWLLRLPAQIHFAVSVLTRPVEWLVQGVLITLFSVVWTIAWLSWQAR